MIKIIKKDGTLQPFDVEKVVSATNKSAFRVMHTFTEQEIKDLKNKVIAEVNSRDNWEKYDLNPDTQEVETAYVTVPRMHSIVEKCLDTVNPEIAKSYRDYRNYKMDFVAILDSVYKKSQSIMYIGDKENANSDSTLASTKRSLIYGQLNKELYQKFFLNRNMLQACRDGYIYIHDMTSRRDSVNCCLFDMANVLNGGFEMGNMFYNEPKSLDTAFDVIGDVILSAASQQYGGFTVPRIDEILIKYAERSYNKYHEELLNDKIQDIELMGYSSDSDEYHSFIQKIEPIVNKKAMDKVRKDMEQGFQGLEYKLNTVASSRGDYPFTTITIGASVNTFAVMAAESALKVRKNGQGKPGFKRSPLFPKVVFTYTKDLHGPGAPLEDLFEKAIECSMSSMYPDFLSLDGDTHLSDMWHNYGEIVAPMGCRAFLSPYWEKGGLYKDGEDDRPYFTGRFNCGAVSLHLPMIYAKAKQESRDFYEVLDEYLQLIREVHIKTKEYLGEMKASTNPLAFCEGGFHGGNLKPSDKIKPLLEQATFSFGITALNELNRIHNGKSIREDGEFPLEVMRYINNKLEEFKKEDHIAYAVYGKRAGLPY